MKKNRFLSVVIFAIPVFCTAFFSFTNIKGGDFFAIYLNGRQVHRQFMHIDQRVKTLELQASDDNDKIEVVYSHCGQMGKNRILTLRNEKNELVKELKFPDAKDNQSMMGFYRRDIANKITGIVNLYYSSKEIPEGKWLATIHWNEQKVIAKH